MKLIREFDPWRNKLCTCPPKYTFNPYTGCRFSCRYCYITSYIKDGFNPRRKDISLYTLEKDIAKVSRTRKPLALSLSTDPYQPLENRYRMTYKILKLLKKYGVPTLITTKSPLILRDIDILQDMNVVVSLTITSLDMDKASKLEPYAPSPKARLETARKLSMHDIPVVIRIDPIIPSITDGEREINHLIHKCSESGARHIVASIYKSKPDNLKRMIDKFPNFRITYQKIYGDGNRINGYRYPDRKYSFKILSYVKKTAEKYGLTFNTCRDGLEYLDTIGCYCDGSHLLHQ